MLDSSPLHRPLEDANTTRFLRLLPRHQSEYLSVELFHGNLAQRPVLQYEALSYTWGEPLPTKTILCNGLPFELRENAYNFLDQLCRPHSVRVVWMDCICIDQNNIREREQQVGIMHTIYQLPAAVIVWLGPGNTQTDTIMRRIAGLHGAEVLSEIQESVFELRAYPRKKCLFDGLAETEDNKQLVQAINVFFSRPWFSTLR